MVTFGSHVGNHQFQPCLSGVYAGVIFFHELDISTINRINPTFIGVMFTNVANELGHHLVWFINVVGILVSVSDLVSFDLRSHLLLCERTWLARYFYLQPKRQTTGFTEKSAAKGVRLSPRPNKWSSWLSPVDPCSFQYMNDKTERNQGWKPLTGPRA